MLKIRTQERARFFMTFMAVTALLAGCKTPPPPPPAPAPVDPVSRQLDMSIAAKGNEKPAGPEVKIAAPVYSMQATTVSYWGDASILLKDVAATMKWEFKVTGPEPRLPIYIQVHVDKMPMKHFLTLVARQLSQRADIVLSTGGLELRYRAN